MRLIDADDLLTHKVMTRWDGYKVSEADINNAPTVDAVPVVRCKDCKYIIDRDDGTYGCYRNFMDNCEVDDFCSRGEKK